jgi:hypothetical protein
MKKLLNIFAFVFLSIALSTSLVQMASAASSILGTTGTRPIDITIDGAGNIYTANNTANNVSKITPGGVSTILGTTGSIPQGIAIDGAGNIYTNNAGSVNVTKITPGGVSTILGTTGSNPQKIIVDGSGTAYVTNNASNNVSKITSGGVSTILGTTGSGPSGITIDGAGNIYTSNNFSNDVSKITPAGVSTILGTTGNRPTDITIDGADNIYTANYNSNNVSKITPGGVSTILGTTGANPISITIDGDGNIYTANEGSNNVSKITPGGVSTIFGTTGSVPEAITIDGSGNIYTANFFANNVSKIIDPVHDATVTSGTYTVGTSGGASRTITNVPFGTSKATFESNLTKSNVSQTWDDSSISDPVLTGDTLVVTAEDTVTTTTYTVTILPPSSNATITSGTYTVSTFEGGTGTITSVPPGTSKADFLDNLTEGQAGQTWDDTDISDPVLTGDTLVVTAEDTTTTIIYTIALIVPDIFWFNDGADAQWTTLEGNWWTDETHTVQAGLPGGEGGNYVKTLGTVGPDVDLDTWTEPVHIDASATGISFTSTDAPLTIDVFGDATFHASAANYGNTITGNVTYNDNSLNIGTVSGNAIFKDSSLNYSSGIVSGNAAFNDTTVNSGTVEGDACFGPDAEDDGTVEGDITIPCPAPSVTTSPASALAQTTATLHGEITDTGGQDVVERGFNWDRTDIYGINVVQSAGPYGAGVFSTDLIGLTCGTTYHYRAYAINGADISNGDDTTFTTSPCPSGGGGRGSYTTPPIISINTVCSVGQKFSTTTGKPCTSFTPPLTCTITITLRRGSKGEQVKCLQTKLNILSDGIFGPITKATVILFQKAHLLVPDGVVGPKTRAALNK